MSANRHYYRCCKCRSRNVFRHALEWYLRPKKCKNCSRTRFYVDKERQNRSDYCSCEGYHWKHRLGSPFCEHNKAYELNVRVGRYGEAEEDVKLEIAFRNEGHEIDEGLECPF